MSNRNSVVEMPELLIILKPFMVGFFLAEVWVLMFGIGSLYSKKASELDVCLLIISITAILALCCYYCHLRNIFNTTRKIINSHRIDLFASLILGILFNSLIYKSTESYHSFIFVKIHSFTPIILTLLLIVIFSPILQNLRAKKHTEIQNKFFLSDIEIRKKDNDFLEMDKLASDFAESVMQSSDVFGVDGPWGTGKTSFINLAEAIWARNSNFLVCRFEPLRFASEPDLPARLIKELTSTIQKSVYAPEFKLVADRYSKLFKGKAEFSFLGIKLSLEQSPETVDELLYDIDEALKRINRRVIIVIDDLDRLDAKIVNNILFATKRTLNLTQATYVLCYDTEILAGLQEDNNRAREFLEKFVTIKFSLFSETSKICDFLRGEWKKHVFQEGSTPSDAMHQLSRIFDELANILESSKAAYYIPMLGNMRKVKRFINAIRLMQIERSDFGRTDFNRRDLINLILLHLNYPGIFRQIYAEETGGNIGSFSLKRDDSNRKYTNSEDFKNILSNSKDNSANFLLKELFCIENITWNEYSYDHNHYEPNELDYASRACFNSGNHRNLQSYLKFIVRVITPEPYMTLMLYKDSLNKIRKNISISSILNSEEFNITDWEYAHERLWIEILNQSYELSEEIVNQAIDTLINFLPKYPSVNTDGRALRNILIYTLIQLLDRASWGSETKRRDATSVLEIAWRIFGEKQYTNNGLLSRLVSNERGALGWFDLLLFRLQCSADRQGQIHNLTTALIRHQNPHSETTGRIDTITIYEMREISQNIFSKFKMNYIDKDINFFDEVNIIPDEKFLGNYKTLEDSNPVLESNKTEESLAKKILIKRSSLKSFVIYQLSNSLPPNGSGVGCGFYDEQGAGDNKGIAKAMNDYLFDFCFNPLIDSKNSFHFIDYCLRNLHLPFETGGLSPLVSESSLSEGLDTLSMRKFWKQHNTLIKAVAQSELGREVYTSNYAVKYVDVLENVFSTLDDIAMKVN